MTLFDRDTLIDRPELIENEEDDNNEEAENQERIEVLGQGGGPTIRGLQFEEGDYDVVSGANAVAVLSTGERGGEVFEQMFINSAMQLKELKAAGRDISSITDFSDTHGLADIGLTESAIDSLKGNTVEDVETEEPEKDEEGGDDTEEETEEEDDSIEEVEQQVEDMKDEDAEEDGE